MNPQETVYIVQLNREWLDNLRDLLKKVSGLNADEAQKFTTLYMSITKGSISADDYQKQVIQQYEASRAASEPKTQNHDIPPSPEDPSKVN